MPELAVDADLRLQVTSPAGRSTTARITGAGQEIRVDVDQPDVLLDAVDPADVGLAADLLAASGITVRVVGPNGLAATIGAGTSSRLGKFVTGSSAVGPTPGAAVRTVVNRREVRLAAAFAALAAVVVVGLRERR